MVHAVGDEGDPMRASAETIAWNDGYIGSFNERFRKVIARMVAAHRGVTVFSGADRVVSAINRSTTSARPAKPGATDMSAATRRLASR